LSPTRRVYLLISPDAPVPIIEGLGLPLATNEQVFGTIWIMSDDDKRHFDREDVRVMKGLADFRAAALLYSPLIRNSPGQNGSAKRSFANSNVRTANSRGSPTW
jgi:GAF domain-containing protein